MRSWPNDRGTVFGLYSYVILLAAMLSYETPLEDRLTHYQSGDSFNVDYGVTYGGLIPSLPQLAFGVAGYLTKQLTSDKLNGVVYNQGNKLQQFAIGPTVTWFLGPASAFSLKVQQQMLSRNTAQGTKIWLEYMFPF